MCTHMFLVLLMTKHASIHNPARVLRRGANDDQSSCHDSYLRNDTPSFIGRAGCNGTVAIERQTILQY